MLDKPLDALTEADLQQLVTNGLPEGKQLEYKEALPSNSDKEKVEFLADISAMANAAGGQIVYGLGEQRDDDGKSTGIPKAPLVGLEGINVDAETRRLEDLLRACLQPRVQGIRFKAITLATGNIVLIVQVPRSWNAPHVVNFQNHWRFYTRTSAGKHQMDVQEVRQAMTFTETVARHLHEFRLGRLAQIAAGETPIALPDGARIVLHLLPLTMMDPASRIDLSQVQSERHRLWPIDAGGMTQRVNVDGYLSYYERGYVQLFRSGAIEAVDAELLRPSADRRFIPSLSLEEALIKAVRQYLPMLQLLGVNPPIALSLSLLGVKDYSLAVDPTKFFTWRQTPIDRPELILPEVLVGDMAVDPGRMMKPLFDMVWNAGGFIESANYDKDGNWHGH